MASSTPNPFPTHVDVITARYEDGSTQKTQLPITLFHAKHPGFAALIDLELLGHSESTIAHTTHWLTHAQTLPPFAPKDDNVPALAKNAALAEYLNLDLLVTHAVNACLVDLRRKLGRSAEVRMSVDMLDAKYLGRNEPVVEALRDQVAGRMARGEVSVDGDNPGLFVARCVSMGRAAFVAQIVRRCYG